MKIDCYGFKESSDKYFKYKLNPVDVFQQGNYTYLRFYSDDKGPIHRIDTSDPSQVHIRWAYGKWSDKQNLQYVTDTNSSIDLGSLK